MDSQNFTEYEISNLVTGESFISDSLEEAIGYFDKGWYVVERRVTFGKFSEFASMKLIMYFIWNNNPDFRRDDYDYRYNID